MNVAYEHIRIAPRTELANGLMRETLEQVISRQKDNGKEEYSGNADHNLEEDTTNCIQVINRTSFMSTCQNGYAQKDIGKAQPEGPSDASGMERKGTSKGNSTNCMKWWGSLSLAERGWSQPHHGSLKRL